MDGEELQRDVEKELQHRVEKEIERYIVDFTLRIADSMDRCARNPEITLQMFATILRAGAASSQEDWNIKRMLEDK